MKLEELLTAARSEFSSGSYEEARRKYVEASKIAEKENDKRMLCIILGETGLTLSKLGKVREALNASEHAYKIAVEEKLKYSQAALLSNIGLNHAEQGMLEMAMSYYNRSLPLFKEMKHHSALAWTKYLIASAAIDLGNQATAIDALLESIAAYRKIGNEEKEKMAVKKLANAYFDSDVETLTDMHIHQEAGLCW